MSKIKIESGYFNDILNDEPIVIGPSAGELHEVAGIRCQFKVMSEQSNGQLGIYQITLQPHTTGARLHFHRFMDEAFFVIKGTVTIESAKGTQEVKTGTVVYLPRFTPHAFSNESDSEAKVLLIFNPAQNREGFFRGLFQAIRENALGTPAHKDLHERYDSPSVTTTLL